MPEEISEYDIICISNIIKLLMDNIRSNTISLSYLEDHLNYRHSSLLYVLNILSQNNKILINNNNILSLNKNLAYDHRCLGFLARVPLRALLRYMVRDQAYEDTYIDILKNDQNLLETETSGI